MNSVIRTYDDVETPLISTTGGRFPRARLQPPQKQRTLLPGSSDSWDCTTVRPIGNHLLFPLESPPFVPINLYQYLFIINQIVIRCLVWGLLFITLFMKFIQIQITPHHSYLYLYS